MTETLLRIGIGNVMCNDASKSRMEMKVGLESVGG